MDKQVSRRDELLQQIDSLMVQSDQRRSELTKELTEVEQRRSDLRETIDILSQQAKGYQEILDRAKAPKIETAVDYDISAVRGAVNQAKADYLR